MTSPQTAELAATTHKRPIRVLDCAPNTDDFLQEVLHGLSQAQKTIACKFFYDERGSQLFDAICELPEYYPTRTELGIMQEHVAQMADCLGNSCMLIEFGSGSGTKTRVLLDHLAEPAAYIPVDISRECLRNSAAQLQLRYPSLRVLPVCADYTQFFSLPAVDVPFSRRAIYFPGSTIGNFTPQEAHEFLCQSAELCGPGGGLLIGVDLKKDANTLEAAYNDAQGVTADFNLNVLHRINEELGGNFILENFEHRAIYNEEYGRIEMHLVSQRQQTVHVDNRDFHFKPGETILTEYSHKYSVQDFTRLVSTSGWQVQEVWTDERQLFSVQYLTVA
jgi:dimethylhistidine N-methyltransferase